MYNPVRVTITDFLNSNGWGWFADSASEHPFNASTPYPVRYTNRTGNDQDGFALDGDYYLRVEANRHDDEPSSTSYLITVVVSGDVEAGPVYQAFGSAGTAPSMTTSTPATTSATDTSAASSATTTSASNPAATPTGQATPITGPAVPVWVWAVVGILAVAAVAALLIARSRRNPSPTPLGGSDNQGSGR
jgi:hypothetical protein